MSYQVLVSQVRQALREEDTLKHPEPTDAPTSVHTNGNNNNNNDNDNATTALLKKKKKPKRRTPDNPPPPPVTQRGDASAPTPTPTPTPAPAPAPSPATVASPPPPPPSLLRRLDRNELAGRAAIVRMLQSVVPPLALRHVWELEGLRRRELLAEETHAFTRRVLVARGNRRRLTGESKPVTLAPSATEAATAPVPEQPSPAGGGGGALHVTKTQSSVPDSFWYDLRAAAMAPASVAAGGSTTLRDAASSPMPAPPPSQPQKQKNPQQLPQPQPQKQQRQQKQPPQPQPQPQQHQQQKQKRSGAKHPRPPGPSASSPPAQASAASAPAPHAPATPHQTHSSASTATHASRSGGGSTAATSAGHEAPLVRHPSKEDVTDGAARRPPAHHKRVVGESSRALPEPPAEGPQRVPGSGRGHPAEPPPPPQPQPLDALSTGADTGVASLIAGSLPGVPLHTQSVSTHVRREGSVVSIVSTTTNTEYALYQPAAALSDSQHNHGHGHGHGHHHHHGHKHSGEAELSGLQGLSAQEATARRRLLRQQSAVRQAVERVMVCTTEVVGRARVNASRLKGWSKIRRAFEAVPAQPAAVPLPASDPSKPPSPRCAVGTRVRVKGLRGKPEFNGRVGLVVRHVDGQVCVRFPDTGAQEFVLRPRFYEAVAEEPPVPTPSVPIGERRRAASQIPVAAERAETKPSDTVRSQSANLAGSVLPSIAPAAVRRQQ